MQYKYSTMICDYLRTHPLITIDRLEAALSLPGTTIAQALAGQRLIPAKHIFGILTVLVGYGMKVNNFDFEYDEQTDTLFGRRMEETVEVVEEPLGRFSYLVKEERIMFSNYHDLL